MIYKSTCDNFCYFLMHSNFFAINYNDQYNNDIDYPNDYNENDHNENSHLVQYDDDADEDSCDDNCSSDHSDSNDGYCERCGSQFDSCDCLKAVCRSCNEYFHNCDCAYPLCGGCENPAGDGFGNICPCEKFACDCSW